MPRASHARAPRWAGRRARPVERRIGLADARAAPAVARAELEARIARWNALELDGCPVVADLRWHLGRPLLSCEPCAACLRARRSCWSGRCSSARAAALGAALDAADLGLPPGAVDLAIGPTGRLPAPSGGVARRPGASACARRSPMPRRACSSSRPEADPEPAAARRRRAVRPADSAAADPAAAGSRSRWSSSCLAARRLVEPRSGARAAPRRPVRSVAHRPIARRPVATVPRAAPLAPSRCDGPGVPARRTRAGAPRGAVLRRGPASRRPSREPRRHRRRCRWTARGARRPASRGWVAGARSSGSSLVETGP